MNNRKQGTRAEMLMDKGHNVGVRTIGPVRNVSYVHTWNTYAMEQGLWVKFVEDIEDEDGDYVQIDVGMPTSTGGKDGGVQN
jgi:hypothetical protein